MQNFFIIFIHLSAAAVALGSLAYCLFVFLPAVEKQSEEADETSPAYKALETLQPTVFVCLLVLIGTGIYTLLAQYSRQGDLPAGYYDLFGIKMACAIAAFFLSLYLTFSLRSRIANLDIRPENRKLVPATLRRMKTLSRLTLGAVTAALFLGVWLARMQ